MCAVLLNLLTIFSHAHARTYTYTGTPTHAHTEARTLDTDCIPQKEGIWRRGVFFKDDAVKNSSDQMYVAENSQKMHGQFI